MRKKSMSYVVILTVITYIVLNMAHPVTPMFIRQNNLPSYLFGVFFATMSIGNFIFSPIWGKRSDKGGRIKYLIIGIVGYGISQIGFGFSKNPIIIIFWRFIGGASVISYLTVILAYIADITDEKNRLKGMTYYGAASTLGGALGSLLGGVIGNNNYKITFFVQFILAIIIAFLHYVLLEESIDKNHVKLEEEKNDNVNKQFNIDFKIVFIMLQVVIFYFATTSYNSSINYYIESILELPPTLNGGFLALAGIFGFLVNIIFTPIIGRKMGEIKALKVMMLLMGLLIGIATVFKSTILFLLFVLFFVGSSAIYLPILQNVISKVSKNNNGKIAGIQNSSRAIGMVIGSLYSGFIFSFGSKLPFITASIVIIIGFIVFVLKNNKFKLEEL